MSHELLLSPETTGDELGVAPAEQHRVEPSAPPPSHGSALSVLWWRESDANKEDEQKPETD